MASEITALEQKHKELCDEWDKITFDTNGQLRTSYTPAERDAREKLHIAINEARAELRAATQKTQ